MYEALYFYSRKYLNDHVVEYPNTLLCTSIFIEICDLDMSNIFPTAICYIPTKLNLRL